MKKEDRVKKEAEKTIFKLESLIRHIRNVQDNCILLGKRLIERGNVELGKKLIKNGFCHDISKFDGIEWENMSPEQSLKEENAKLKLKLAIYHHNSSNFHHPEYWNGIKNVPLIYLAEMVCDLKARSEEFGTSLIDWIDNEALKRYNFTKEDKVYKDIVEFIDLLCEKPFVNLEA